MSIKCEVQVKTFQNMEGLKNVLSHALMFSEIYCGMNSTKGFPGGSVVKNPLANAGSSPGESGSIPGWGRSPGGGNGNPLQYSCLENPHGERSLVGYSPRGHRVGHDSAQAAAAAVVHNNGRVNRKRRQEREERIPT